MGIWTRNLCKKAATVSLEKGPFRIVAKFRGIFATKFAKIRSYLTIIFETRNPSFRVELG